MAWADALPFGTTHPTSDGLMSNGLMSNGLMSDGLMSNGLMSDGLMSNGLNRFEFPLFPTA
jgi:hypothetical protein